MRDGEDEKILQNDIARVSFMIQAQAARGGPPRCARGTAGRGARRYRQSGGCATASGGIAAAPRPARPPHHSKLCTHTWVRHPRARG